MTFTDNKKNGASKKTTYLAIPASSVSMLSNQRKRKTMTNEGISKMIAASKPQPISKRGSQSNANNPRKLRNQNSMNGQQIAALTP